MDVEGVAEGLEGVVVLTRRGESAAERSARENDSAPAVGRASCAAMRSKVLLPEPLAPSSITNSPAAISSVTPRSARTAP